ncbi:MAG: hypothetical protein E4G96_03170 [Chrysiogenales bacterium]|nr:MAG: hypothetical protein E4G96_03170 [Chrysiogenales bacterium]
MDVVTRNIPSDSLTMRSLVPGSLKKMKKIVILIVVLISASLVYPFIFHQMSNSKSDAGEPIYKKVLTVKNRAGLLESRINLSKKRPGSVDAGLCVPEVHPAFYCMDGHLPEKNTSRSVPPPTKYSVWSKSTFS